MALVGDVTSTILANSYYEILTTTQLGTENIDGNPVVTDPNDIFIVKAAKIKIDEFKSLLLARSINPKDTAIRFRALSLAVNPDTTESQLVTALIKYDFHTAIVSVVVEMEKRCAIQADKLFNNKRCRKIDAAFRSAAAEGLVGAMDLLKRWGSEDYDMALYAAAENGQLEAMKLLRYYGATRFNRALDFAAAAGQLEAMFLLKDWGASKYNAALVEAAVRGQLEAMKLLKWWGASDFDTAIRVAVPNNQLEAMRLLLDWRPEGRQAGRSETVARV
jgi:hypothetical protein